MSAQPTTPKGLRTRAHLVDSGRQVFARHGYVDARMSDVADQAEISMGGLYRYFANKEDLFAQVIADLHEELYRASVAREADFATHPYDALVEANRGYLELYRDQRHVMRAFIQAAGATAAGELTTCNIDGSPGLQPARANRASVAGEPAS